MNCLSAVRVLLAVVSYSASGSLGKSGHFLLGLESHLCMYVARA